MFNHFNRYFLLFLLLSGYAFGQVKTLDMGAVAPNFNLIGIDDKNYTLDSYSDADILVIIFTANHGPTAQAYEGRIEKKCLNH